MKLCCWRKQSTSQPAHILPGLAFMDPEELEIVRRQKKFSEVQLERYAIHFKKLAVKGRIDLAGFSKLIKQFGIKVSEKLEDRVFKYISRSRGDQSAIDFVSFMNYFGTLQKGTKDERVNLCFNLIDIEMNGHFGIKEFELLMIDMYLDNSSSYELQHRITAVTIDIFKELCSDEEERELFDKLPANINIGESSLAKMSKDKLFDILEYRNQTLNEYLIECSSKDYDMQDGELPSFLRKRISRFEFHKLLSANSQLYDFFLKLGASLSTLLDLAGQNQYGEISKTLQELWFKFESAFKATGLDQTIRNFELN
jgi:Ca2+-binding EF-hand superfamily protein